MNATIDKAMVSSLKPTIKPRSEPTPMMAASTVTSACEAMGPLLSCCTAAARALDKTGRTEVVNVSTTCSFHCHSTIVECEK